jgi:hypothetical protein
MMTQHVSKKLKANDFFAIPSGVYHHMRKSEKKNGGKMVYSGSGAPWQWLERLSLIWQKIHKKDSSIEFLVISRDS